MKKKIILLLSFFQLCLYSSCNDAYYTLDITDFSKPQEFFFRATKDSTYNGYKPVGGHTLLVQGNVTGSVYVGTIAGGGDLTGRIDTAFRDDWSSTEVKLEIVPKGHVEGRLKIRFIFVE